MVGPKMVPRVGRQIHQREDVFQLRPLLVSTVFALTKNAFHKGLDIRHNTSARAIQLETAQVQQFAGKFDCREGETRVAREARSKDQQVACGI